MTAQNPGSNPAVGAFSLHGKVALVTGASTGLGQGIAIALAQAGADVVGVARSSTADAERGVTAAGRKFHALHADLERRHEAANVVAQAIKTAGRVDILVNNAGIIRRDDALTFGEEDWDAAKIGRASCRERV